MRKRLRVLAVTLWGLDTHPRIRILFCLSAVIFVAGFNNPSTSTSPSNPSSSSSTPSSTSSTPSAPAATPNQGLTNAKVETAVADLLSDWKMGGSISVRGIQENSQTNSAIADLLFNDFEYGVTFEGQILKKSQFKMPAKSGNPIPPPEEMFPPRKVKYSKDGKATLSMYNDGRWVLKAVNWGFDSGVKGTVEIR